jgi:hypothetical protein
MVRTVSIPSFQRFTQSLNLGFVWNLSSAKVNLSGLTSLDLFVYQLSTFHVQAFWPHLHGRASKALALPPNFAATTIA